MKAALFMGSDSDWPIMKPAVELLKEFGVEVDVIVASAHRTPAKVHEYAESARENGVGVIIAAAGAGNENLFEINELLMEVTENLWALL